MNWRRVLNWLNGVRDERNNVMPSKPVMFGRSAIAPLPQGEGRLTKWRAPRTSPLSETRKGEYRKTREQR